MHLIAGFFYSTYYVFLVTIGLTMKAFFRALAAAFPGAAPAQAVAGVVILALSLYTGFQIPRPQMIGALKWITWINVRSIETFTKVGSLVLMQGFIACVLRVQLAHGERISYIEWTMLIARPFRTWI